MTTEKSDKMLGQSYIKPWQDKTADLTNYATKTYVDEGLAEKQDSGDYATNTQLTEGLAEKQHVLTAGTNITITDNVISAVGIAGEAQWGEITGTLSDQTDLQSALNAKVDSEDLATVATSGSYDDLSDKPQIPDAQVQADWDETDTTSKAYIQNKPVIPSGVIVDSSLDSTSENPVQNKVINTALETKVDSSSLSAVATSGAYSDLSGKPSLATVATSGDYDDLSNKPTIPDVSGLASVTYVDSEIDAVEAQIPDVSGLASETYVDTAVGTKQDTLVSGTNIKTVNSESILGSGDIAIEGIPDTSEASSGDVLTFDGTDVGWQAGGGSAPSNMVTTDTEQTITGQKMLAGTGTVNIKLRPNSSYTDMYHTCRIGAEVFYGNTKKLFIGYPGCELGITNNVIDGIGSGLAFFSYSNLPFVVRQHTGGSFSATDDLTTSTRTTFATPYWVKSLIPESTITGDGTTTTFTVAHSLRKMPGIVQVTASDGAVVKDSEISIVKSTTNVVVTFTTAPTADATYTVAMLY